MQHLLVPTEVLFGKRTRGVKIIDVTPGSLGAELEVDRVIRSCPSMVASLKTSSIFVFMPVLKMR